MEFTNARELVSAFQSGDSAATAEIDRRLRGLLFELLNFDASSRSAERQQLFDFLLNTLVNHLQSSDASLIDERFEPFSQALRALACKAMKHPSPRLLTRALQAGDPDAQEQFKLRLTPVVSSLIANLIAQHRLTPNRQKLIDHTLIYLKAYARTRDLHEVDHDWNLWTTTLGVRATRLLWAPIVEATKRVQNRAAHAGVYSLRIHENSHDAVSGDWWGNHVHEGALWLVLVDAMGHAEPAHVVARGFVHLWRFLWETSAAWQVSELWGRMHDELVSILPDGVFLEGVLARISGAGTVEAIGTLPLLWKDRRSADCKLLECSGFLLGVDLGERTVPQTLSGAFLAHSGDELVFATDGLYDQSTPEGRLGKLLPEALQRLDGAVSLHDWLVTTLQAALQTSKQHDDVTIVTLRRD